MSKTLSDIDILRDTPSSIAEDEQIQALAQSFTEQLLRVNSAIEHIVLWDNLSDFTDNQLKHLAWWLHVDTWDDNYVRSKREELIRQSISWHRRKGTPGMVEEIVKSIYLQAEIQENWKYNDGKPYHFRIVLHGQSMDIESRTKLLHLIRQVKNVRSWLDGLYYLTEIETRKYIKGYCRESFATNIPANTSIDINVQESGIYTGGYVMPESIITNIKVGGVKNKWHIREQLLRQRAETL